MIAVAGAWHRLLAMPSESAGLSRAFGLGRFYEENPRRAAIGARRRHLGELQTAWSSASLTGFSCHMLCCGARAKSVSSAASSRILPSSDSPPAAREGAADVTETGQPKNNRDRKWQERRLAPAPSLNRLGPKAQMGGLPVPRDVVAQHVSMPALSVAVELGQPEHEPACGDRRRRR